MWGIATAEIEGRAEACLVIGERLVPLRDLDAALGTEAVPLVAAWERSLPALERAAAAAAEAPVGRMLAGTRLLAPLLYPGKILCAGANYYDHMAEMGFPGVTKESQRLFFFMKPPRNAVVGSGDTVVMPRGTAMFDWEVELAAVIGRRARYVSAEEALSHVAGYTVAVDFSARDFNRAPDQFYKLDWVAGKACDTCCPLGPWIVPASSIPDPQALSLRLWLNGEPKQDGTSASMIHSVAEQIARASEIMTLDPGDVLLTGTPSGVGVPKGTFLKAGDRVEAEIERIGRLSLTIQPPSA